MNLAKPTLLTCLFFIAATHDCFSQNTSLGVFISSGFSFPTEQQFSPGLSAEFGGLVEVELGKDWRLRTGGSFNSLSYTYNIGSPLFEDQIDAIRAGLESTKYQIVGVNVPLLMNFRKSESVVGVLGGFDVLLPFYQKTEKVYTFGTVKTTITALDVNPAINLGVQLHFPLKNERGCLDIEPLSKLYLSRFKTKGRNVMSLGIRVVYLK